VERIFERYVLPEWGDRQVESIEKSDVADLLSKIAERKIKGPSGEIIGTFSVARATCVQLSSFFNWYIEDHASRRFRSPIVKSKSKRWAQPQGRERVLDDDEIRALWRATGKMAVYGAVVRSALLTAQRFHKVSTMLKADLTDQVKVPRRRVDGHWIKEFEVADVFWDPTRNDDPLNKGVSLVPLSPLAREVIDSASDVNGENSQGLVFSLKGEGPLRGWSKFKNQLDKAMLEEMRTEAKKEGRDPNKIQLKPWQHRDLRRTARTLMSRSEVSNDIAELCLGHAGVEKTCDKHDYLDRKQVAFKRLSDHIQMIVYGPATDEGKIVQLHGERA
jgi:integrase